MRLLIASTILVLASWPTIAGPDYPFPEELAATQARASVASIAAAPPVAVDPPASSGDEADASSGPDASAQVARDLSREELCDALASAAQANDLPVGFFVRLIWQESRFIASAVSRAGAQGLAQFMPAVAAEHGLANPFDPRQALPKSAEFLRLLRREFGNLGLAAAAYNAGSGRIKSWLERRAKLPEQLRARARLPRETEHYVTVITGHAPERWIGGVPENVGFAAPARGHCRDEIEADEPQAEARIKVADAGGAVSLPRQQSPAAPVPARAILLKPRVVQVVDTIVVAPPRQRSPAASVKSSVVQVVDVAAVSRQRQRARGGVAARAALLTARSAESQVPPADAGAAKPWGVQLAGSFSETKAKETFERLRKTHPAIIGNRAPQVVRARLAGKGATQTRIQLALDTRAGAEQFCSALRTAGGACMVVRN